MVQRDPTSPLRGEDQQEGQSAVSRCSCPSLQACSPRTWGGWSRPLDTPHESACALW